MGQLDNKGAFITGAASGIGAATTLRFLNEGATVYGADIAEPPAALVKQFKEAGTFHFHAMDVLDEGSIESAVGGAISALGGISILVNAAGVSSGGPSEEIPLEEWERVININLRGTFLVCKYVVRNMLANQSGSIVNIASIEGIQGFNQQVSYGVSKGGVVQLTRNLAVDYAAQGVRVNCVCPGVIETPMTEIMNEPALIEMRDKMKIQHLMGRFGKPHEMASCILFLASEESSFVTGHALVADGGYTAGHNF